MEPVDLPTDFFEEHSDLEPGQPGSEADVGASAPESGMWVRVAPQDRYIFGVARTPDEVPTLVAEALDRIALPGA